MSEPEIKPDLSSLRLLKNAHSTTASKTIVSPPSHFVDTIKNRSLALCPSCCFVLYGLNSVELKFDNCQTNEVPFELFKECYHKNKTRFDFSKYFEVEKVDIPIDQEATFEGTTIGDACKEEISVLPLILKYHRTTLNLNTARHLDAHFAKLRSLFKKFIDGRLNNLYINWSKLIESYVELVFRDLLVKWCQWLHTIKPTGYRRSAQIMVRTWLNRLCKLFWTKYFIFENGQKTSIIHMGSRLMQFAQTSKWNPDGTTASYGIWMDSKNCIIIFASGVGFEEVQVCPTYGTCIEQTSPDAITMRLLFYVNIAILQCFVSEIA